MTGRGMSLIATVRRVLSALPGAASARIVRDRLKLELPLSQQVAHLVQPVGSEQLAWPESAQWQYELNVFVLATVGRGRPGTAAQQRLADLHDAALAALASDATLGGSLADGPPGGHADLKGLLAGFRRGETAAEKSKPGDPLAVATVCGLCLLTDSPSESTTLDGSPLFDSGPNDLVADSPRRETADRLFNGLRGVLVVDLGERPRQIVQVGRLSAASAAGLAQLESAVEAKIDGQTHQLMARDGSTYSTVRVERFIRRGPVEVGDHRHRPYRIEYTELLRDED
ncbi:MAG: hypothetical protein GWP05_03035 [Anaerolineaceae bacterium]|nr:hypothetical protein [Anaerolineaceae bacterium]